MFGCFWTNGQICSATSRLLVHERFASRFLAALVKATRAIEAVDPNKPNNKERTGVLGPLVSKKQWQRVRTFINQAKKEGATVLTGGGFPANQSKGFFVEPTILQVEPHHSVWSVHCVAAFGAVLTLVTLVPLCRREEIFGPVLSVMQFRDEAHAIALANDSDYGLAGAVLSADKQRCARVANALRCGIVWANCSQVDRVDLRLYVWIVTCCCLAAVCARCSRAFRRPPGEG